MNVICRHCLKTNRIRKELRGKWTRCQFCNAEMEEPAPSASKSRRNESAPAMKPDPVPPAVAPLTTAGKSGGGFGKFILIVLAVGTYLFYQHWAEQRRIERERQLASERQFMEFLGSGAKAAVQGLFSSPSKPPQDIGPSNPALRSPPPPQRQTEITTFYDENNKPVGQATTTRILPPP